MDKRRFLLTGTATAGVVLLSRYLPLASEKTATAAETSKILTKTEQEWQQILTPEQFYVLRKHGTELAHSSPLVKEYSRGNYVCAGCNSPLFSSIAKFDSGTGWPSFYKPIDGAIGTTTDQSFFMTRVEVHCKNCGGHLGHVFDDGPKPTGLRYCMNGVALKFIAKTI